MFIYPLPTLRPSFGGAAAGGNAQEMARALVPCPVVGHWQSNVRGGTPETRTTHEGFISLGGSKSFFLVFLSSSSIN